MKQVKINFMLGAITLISLLMACESPVKMQDDSISTVPEASEYWYDGKAEISSYELVQARYGEMHTGSAVMIFVTEPFSKKSWTKADNTSNENIPVMKLNFTKKFNTGIYPYSMMTSSFFPFNNGKQSAKISSSMQEWCGHTFMELKNKKQFEIRYDSYFEGESKKKITLDKAYLEDDFWTMIRLNPKDLPIGKINAIPSFSYLTLTHEDIVAYDCEANLKAENGEMVYHLNYPDLERELEITFAEGFPYKILSWKETYNSGWGASRKKLTTTAKLKESIRIDYWSKNKVSDSRYREQLRLDE